MMDNRDSVVVLRGGRRLGYREFGDPDGTPLLYFHGFPGSRLEAAFANSMLRRNRIRLVAIERPGYGLSDPLPGRRLIDWPDDVRAVASALRFEKFAILGVSVGSCYALACARAIPEQISHVGIAGALAPLGETDLLPEMNVLSRYCFAATRNDSSLARWIYGRILGMLVRHASGGFLSLLRCFSQAGDKQALADKAFHSAVRVSMSEAYRQGWFGPYYDLTQVAGDWGFSLADITIPVHLWHGEEDKTVPLSMGRHLARRIPECRARFLPGEGHFSMTRHYMEEAVQVLSGQRPGASRFEFPASPPVASEPQGAASC